MKTCNQSNNYLDGDLGQTEFNDHLANCATCDPQTLENWSIAVDIIRRDASAHAHRSSAQVEREHQLLVSSFALKKSIPVWQLQPMRWVLASMAIVGCFFIVGILFLNSKDDVPSSTMLPATVPIVHFHNDGSIRKTTTIPKGAIIKAKDNERLLATIDNDRVAVGPGGEIHLNRTTTRSTSLVLNRGWLACSVSKRSQNEKFVTHTFDDRFTVEVKGTRFGVNYHNRGSTQNHVPVPQFQVAVTEGVVWVTEKNNKTWIVKAGEQLIVQNDEKSVVETLSHINRKRINTLLNSESKTLFIQEDKPAPEKQIHLKHTNSFTSEQKGHKKIRHNRRQDTNLVQHMDTQKISLLEIKQLIVGGRHSDAIEAIEQCLLTDPLNSELWRLLAQSKRKSGKFLGAVAAYNKVIKLAPRPIAKAARFKTGLIYQNQLRRPSAAIVQFSKYLSTPGPQLLRAEALLHLGEAELFLGNHTKAKTHMKEVIDKHSATAAAMEARRKIQLIP